MRAVWHLWALLPAVEGLYLWRTDVGPVLPHHGDGDRPGNRCPRLGGAPRAPPLTARTAVEQTRMAGPAARRRRPPPLRLGASRRPGPRVSGRHRRRVGDAHGAVPRTGREPRGPRAGAGPLRREIGRAHV